MGFLCASFPGRHDDLHRVQFVESRDANQASLVPMTVAKASGTHGCPFGGEFL